MTRTLDIRSFKHPSSIIWAVSDLGHVIPLRVDENGNLIVSVIVGDDSGLEQDDISGALVNIPVVHHEVHEGEMYQASFVNLAVADDATVDLRLVTGAHYCHFVWDAECGGDGEIQFYEAPTISLGTQLTVYNMNRPASADNTLDVYHTPTVGAVGTALLHNSVLSGGRGPNASGGSARANTEWILKPNTEYLLRLYNRSGNSQPASIVVQWYEEEGNV